MITLIIVINASMIYRGVLFAVRPTVYFMSLASQVSRSFPCFSSCLTVGLLIEHHSRQPFKYAGTLWHSLCSSSWWWSKHSPQGHKCNTYATGMSTLPEIHVCTFRPACAYISGKAEVPVVSCTTVVVHNRDRLCYLVNPNRAHTYIVFLESSSTTKETLDVHLSCPNAHQKLQMYRNRLKYFFFKCWSLPESCHFHLHLFIIFFSLSYG